MNRTKLDESEPYTAVALEDLLPQVGSCQYRLIRLAMVRALQIEQGSPPLVAFHAREKPTTIALREIAEGRINVKPGTGTADTASDDRQPEEETHG